MNPGLMTRYLLGRFLRAFAFVFCMISILAFITDAFDSLGVLLRVSSASFPVLLLFLWLKVPFWAIKAVPVATLLATLFVATDLIRSGEWIAAQASGFRPGEMARPFFLGAVLVTLATFAAQETVLPIARERSLELYHYRIKPQGGKAQTWRDILIAAGPDKFLMTREFDMQKGRMERVVMDEYRNGRLWRQWDAGAAAWDPHTAFWVFEKGVQREFGASAQPVREKVFERETSELRLPPKELAPREWDPDSMSLKELRRHIRRLQMLDASDVKARTALHLKIAYPFANLVMCALALPFAFRSRALGKSLHLAAALGLAFTFWCSLLSGQALGDAGFLPVPVAAWGANALFAGIAFWLYRTTDSLWS